MSTEEFDASSSRWTVIDQPIVDVLRHYLKEMSGLEAKMLDKMIAYRLLGLKVRLVRTRESDLKTAWELEFDEPTLDGVSLGRTKVYD